MKSHTHTSIPMTQNAQLIDYVLKLRFGDLSVNKNRVPVLNLTSVAALTKVSVKHLPQLIKIGLLSLENSSPIKPKIVKKLRKEHIDFLISQETLRLWAHLSLKQRAQMFHR